LDKGLSFEAEVEFEVVEPGEARVDVFVLEFIGQLFEVATQLIGTGGRRRR